MARFGLRVMLCALAAGWLTLACAQQAAVPADYRIHPGDTIGIIVQNHPEYSIEQVTVLPDGKIGYPLGGPVAVGGKTVQEVTRELLARLRRELRNPVVTVNVISTRPRNVFVLGEVLTPGPYDLARSGAEEISVAAAIALAGGYTEAADQTRVTIIRKGLQPETVTIERGRAEEIKLAVGDAVVVPKKVQLRVTVLGEVTTPGVYLLGPDDNLLTIIARAGMTASTDRNHALLMHGDGRQEEIDISGLGSGNVDVSKLPRLADGDVIVFLPARREVVVLGEVTSPGSVQLQPKMTIVDVLAARGGPTKDADLKKVLVVRPDGSQQETDLSGLRAGRLDLATLPKLVGGETIIVRQARNDVVVMGEVSAPGRIQLLPQMTVIDALAAAGGPTEQADLTRVEIVDREGNRRRVAVVTATGEFAAQADTMRLEGGETITVPRKPMLYATVWGYVQTPGRVQFEPGERVADVVARAGGPIPGQARPEQTVLVRSSAAAGKSEVIRCDLSKLVSGEGVEQNVIVQAGDFIYVPGRAERAGSGDWLRSIVQLGSIAALISKL